jgi:hypothetical protein
MNTGKQSCSLWKGASGRLELDCKSDAGWRQVPLHGTAGALRGGGRVVVGPARRRSQVPVPVLRPSLQLLQYMYYYYWCLAGFTLWPCPAASAQRLCSAPALNGGRVLDLAAH